MTRYFSNIECKSFYLSYIGMICLYMILLRLNACPSVVAYLVYAFSIIFFIRPFFSKGFVGSKNKLDVIVILYFLVYYIISSLIYSVGDTSDSSWLFKDYLYSLLPLISYILIRTSRFRIDKQLFLKTTLLVIFAIDVISLIQFIAPSSAISILFNKEQFESEAIAFALNGLLGVIQMGFVNVIGLAICLLSPLEGKVYFKYALSLLFIICALLTGQRTPIGGIAIVLFCYSLRYKVKGIIGICLLLGAFYYLFNNVNIEASGFSVNEMLSERTLDRLSSTKSGSSNREDQQVILIDSAFGMLFGDGVGCYSPNNPESKNAMPDAMLYRIFNEMGIIGLMLYISFWLKNFFYAIRRNDAFMVAFIFYIFFANYFNRVLFIAPISIIPLSIVALFNWNDNEKNETTRIVNKNSQ